MNLLFLVYNNYANRIAKKFDTLAEYLNCENQINVNTVYTWNKADGVTTEQVLTLSIEDVNFNPDYVVAYDDDNNIDSRWFVLEFEELSVGTYKAVLRRDVIDDNFEAIIEADSYIEKATVPNTEDVAIYNEEAISFNQIKKDEKLIKDFGGSAWIVGFFTKLDNAINDTVPADINVTNIYGSYSTENDFFDEINYTTGWRKPTWRILNTTINLKPTLGVKNKYTFDWLTNTHALASAIGIWKLNITDVVSDNNEREAICKDIDNLLLNNKKRIFDVFEEDPLFDLSLYNAFKNNNRIVKIGSAFKRVVISESSVTTETTYIESNDVVDILENVLIEKFGSDVELDTGSFALNGAYTYINYTITLVDADINAYSWSIPTTTESLRDAPYKMFAMPLDSVSMKLGADTPIATIGREAMMNVAQSVILKMGDNLKDVQLLPYCPWQTLYKAVTGSYVFVGNTDDERQYILDSSNNKVGFILFPKYSSFTFDYNINLSLSRGVEAQKIELQCSRYRLASPNYASSFEFNLTKTGGIKKLNIDCTYKPFNSYIHINPVWGRLYGGDYNDVRGLICQGDFSYPALTSAWENYQINNKNFQNSFNREIETFELQNKYQKDKDMLSYSTGSIDLLKKTSSKTNYANMVQGGLAQIGNVMNFEINEALRQDALDLKKDQFNYNLQNIQALPYTLSKVSSYDYNNKLFPVLEYYSCTDQEKEIFKKKMKYNGMTIMRIDKIKNFLTSEEQFIKAQLIRINIKEDYHLVSVIKEELEKGVYFNG